MGGSGPPSRRLVSISKDPLSLSAAAPITSYAAVSVSNVVATFCQYEALKYVSFPIQTLAKTAKMIPVMIWGTIIMRKVYTAVDYGMAAAITAGCTVFVLTGDVGSGRHHKAADASAAGLSDGTLGLLLMLGYLGFDGFTSTFQDKLFKAYEMSMYNQVRVRQLASCRPEPGRPTDRSFVPAAGVRQPRLGHHVLLRGSYLWPVLPGHVLPLPPPGGVREHHDAIPLGDDGPALHLAHHQELRGPRLRDGAEQPAAPAPAPTAAAADGPCIPPRRL